MHHVGPREQDSNPQPSTRQVLLSTKPTYDSRYDFNTEGGSYTLHELNKDLKVPYCCCCCEDFNPKLYFCIYQQVNGLDLTNATHQEAKEALSQVYPICRLTVYREKAEEPAAVDKEGQVKGQLCNLTNNKCSLKISKCWSFKIGVLQADSVRLII